MIIRIMGEGQWRVDDSMMTELNKLDTDLEAAVEASRAAGFHEALDALLALVRQAGTELPPDAIEPSDLILPNADATMEDVRKLMTDGGLIPG